jgi:hypothetical protein
MVHDRWILGQHVDDPVLSAPELGPIVDIGAAYHAVAAMRAVPLGKASLVPLAVAAALPMVALVALQVPIVTVLKKLLAALA